VVGSSLQVFGWVKVVTAFCSLLFGLSCLHLLTSYIVFRLGRCTLVTGLSSPPGRRSYLLPY
jgi:hypothetical protein